MVFPSSILLPARVAGTVGVFVFTLVALLSSTTTPARAQTPRPSRAPAEQAWSRHAAQSHATLTALNQPAAPAPALPPPPAGVTDLAFAEFFGPIGDRGLEYSARLRALDGQRVRLVGYMVRTPAPTPGLFLFAGWPTTLAGKGACGTDDAPPTAVHVFLAPGVEAATNSAARPAPYRPGRLVLIGRLALGPRAEADGRNSTVRLVLDADASVDFFLAPANSPAPP
ncbi:MAG: hypothetical protein RLZZ15_3479 [Verrucomicrobiota bacterium]|jgi:hypothetical protein